MIDKFDTLAEVYSTEELSNLYLLLAELFLGNGKKMKKMIDGEDFSPSSLKSENEGDLFKLIQSLKDVPEKELKILYENLFLIPGAFYVPPYGAYYLYNKNDDISTSDFLEEIGNEYEREGFLQFAESKYLRLDHLGLMFMYLHFLLLRDDEEEDSRKKVANFVQTKLNPWFGEFEKKVSSSLDYGFYLELVQYVHQFLDMQGRR